MARDLRTSSKQLVEKCAVVSMPIILGMLYRYLSRGGECIAGSHSNAVGLRRCACNPGTVLGQLGDTAGAAAWGEAGDGNRQAQDQRAGGALIHKFRATASHSRETSMAPFHNSQLRSILGNIMRWRILNG
jgi:hypothetical protein